MTSWERHRASLHLTRQWCANHANVADPAGCLRSAAWRPPEYPEEWMYSELHPTYVDELIAKRSLSAEKLSLASSQALGRILLVLGGEDTAMGEGTLASDGFIDDTYLPPWDTWFACIQAESEAPVLLAWIPSVFEPLVQSAIDVAASQHISWLDTWGTEFEADWWVGIRKTLSEARAALP